MELPPLIQYPVILLIFGALSFPFTFLFGSGSLGGDRVATPPSEPTAGETCVYERERERVCVCVLVFDKMRTSFGMLQASFDILQACFDTRCGVWHVMRQ